MTDKIQELTDKLYNEGLAKGKADGEVVLRESQQRAAAIIAEAEEKAAAIVAKAEKDAEDIRAKVRTDVRMAASQSMQALKTDIENLMVKTAVGDKTDAELRNPEFIRNLILTVAGKFDGDGPVDMNLVLPLDQKEDLENWLSTGLASSLNAGIKADFSRKITGGFTIGPADKGYFVSLTDESFRNLFSEYLRPVTKKLLFGE